MLDRNLSSITYRYDFDMSWLALTVVAVKELAVTNRRCRMTSFLTFPKAVPNSSHADGADVPHQITKGRCRRNRSENVHGKPGNCAGDFRNPNPSSPAPNKPLTPTANPLISKNIPRLSTVDTPRQQNPPFPPQFGCATSQSDLPGGGRARPCGIRQRFLAK